MAIASVGPGLVMPGIQPWSESALSAPTSSSSAATVLASSSASAQPAASAAPSTLGQDSYGAASTPPASSTSSGVVQAKSFLSNIWDMFFGPLLNGLWGLVSSIFHGL